MTASKVQVESPLLTPGQTSAYLGGVPEGTLTAWRYRQVGPKYKRLGRHIRYHRDDLDEWIAAQTKGGK